MRSWIRLSRSGGSLVAVPAILAVGLLMTASMAQAKGENVTFINKSGRTQQLLAAFGGDGACSEMPEKQNLKIEAGEQTVLESGDSKVCWCAGSGKNKVSSCQEWKTARPGSKVRLRF